MFEDVSFNSDLANVLFGTAADPEREPQEVGIVERMSRIFETATSSQIFRHAPFVDAVVFPRLSGRNLLAVAKLIERRYSPGLVQNTCCSPLLPNTSLSIGQAMLLPGANVTVPG